MDIYSVELTQQKYDCSFSENLSDSWRDLNFLE